MQKEVYTKFYDVIIVGGGHAGCEAALAVARMGFSALLITGSIDRIAAMSCNPAIGGVGKGHLVKEIDALGGEMARVADETGIHFRTLNSSRGPAVRATRCQSDMERYRQKMGSIVAQTSGLSLKQDDVVGILRHESGSIKGIQTRHGGPLLAKRVILTTGTFLGGQLHLGNFTSDGGRAGEAPTRGLSASLKANGLELGRLKTGTCPRLDGRTIHWSQLEIQQPETPAPRFSFDAAPPLLPQVPCHLTYTSSLTHQTILDTINEGNAPIYNGQISGSGPRYCPSIEDKVVRFGQKESHLIFLEPHGLDTFEVYPNGLTTSLPPEAQIRFLRTIKGLEEVEVTRWGYAVEYDFVPPTQLFSSLETKSIPGLFCAGQLNGTTGYEEAAAQGLLAGINAALSLHNRSPLILPRHTAYMGVLVDDLVTKGTQEPYRMFTSRAEHRLILREDNVYARLMDIGHEVGLLPQRQHESMKAFEAAVASEQSRLNNTKVYPTPETEKLLTQLSSAPLKESITLASLLKRPEITAENISLFDTTEAANTVDFRIRLRAAIETKYAGYIARNQKTVDKEAALESALIPSQLFHKQLPGMSNEVFEKLRFFQPRTLGQAARISGITPAAISLLAVEIQRSSNGNPSHASS